MKHLLGLLVFAIVLTTASGSRAQLFGPSIPDSLSFQGQLTETNGDPVADGFYDLVFKLYKDGTSVWEQTHTNVPVSGGVFNVLLGGDGAASLDTVAFSVPMELGISVEGDPEMVPRIPLAAAAYSMATRWFHGVDASDGPIQSPNTIVGSSSNLIDDGFAGSTIGGGGGLSVSGSYGNHIEGSFATIGGGRSNMAGAYSTIGGGLSNVAEGVSTVGGGNSNEATNAWATVGGGDNNTASGVRSFVGGGEDNLASQQWATVSGGLNNQAIGETSWIGGGGNNVASGGNSMIPGGAFNSANGATSMAAGRYAVADHDGSFVWNSSADSLVTTDVNQFLIGSTRVGINENGPATVLHVQNNNLGLGSANMQNDVVVVEGSDPVIGLYGSQGGNWNAGVVLGELTTVLGAGILVNKWAMARNTTAGGNYLRFTYGTDPDYSANDTQMRIEPGGDVRADGSFIGGGADVAEAFDVSGDVASYEPGDVLVISESADRQVAVSNKAYSTLIAGVYATKPGVLLSNLHIDADLSKKVPLAVVGVVPTKVTVEGGPIRRGDLLVTSSTEGHAMKADPDLLRFGMSIGKALENFDGPGSGLIEVLVNVK